MDEWAGLDSAVAVEVEEQNRRLLDVYRADPARLEQDANIERSISEGAYANRQLFELLQNAADAMRHVEGRCEVVLTNTTLYVANTGDPLTVGGAMSLMATHRSVKRGEQIGRFGLGFKSVLAVSDSPRIFSRSGSVSFDRGWSRAELEREIPGRVFYPVTRLARAVDPADWRHDDAILDGLMGWATTVVVVPIRAHFDVLATSIRSFPAPFLLFSQHVARLQIRDATQPALRRLTLSRTDDGLLQLDDDGKKSTWVLQTRTHVPSQAALADGGYQAARESVEVTWAAPVGGARVAVGAFWAYFPTPTQTTLSGYVNAPWKLADDRESLLPGRFNDELLTEVLPAIVVDALPRIYSPDRAATVIDVLPARGDEARSYADSVINHPVIDAVGRVASVPTLGGVLRHPSRVRLHPKEAEPDELEMWRSACEDPDRWVDHSIYSNERRSKVLRLLAQHQKVAVSVREWLEHLVRHGSVEGSAVAVRLVAKLRSRLPDLRDDLSKAKVLLLDDASVHACRPGEVFLPGGDRKPGKLYIDPRLAGYYEVGRALKELGIRVLDDAGALRSELSAQQIRWENVWPSTRRNTTSEAEMIFRDVMGRALLTDLRVRTRSGMWKPPGWVFLPGEIVPGDGSRDPGLVVDDRYHQQDVDLLERLGVVSRPRVMSTPPVESWRRVYEADLRDSYRKHRQRPKLPDESIEVEVDRILWPLEPLKELSAVGRAALVRAVLNQLDPEHAWFVGMRGGGDRMRTTDPTWRYLRRHGYLPTEVGLQPITRCLAFVDEAAIIDGVRQPLPFVDSSITPDVAEALKLGDDLQRLNADQWSSLIEESGGWTPDRRVLLYAWAALYEQQPPTVIRAQRGRGFVKLSPTEVATTSSKTVFDSLVEADCPAVLAASEDDARILQLRWGLAVGENMLDERVEPEFSGEPFNAVDRFPPLRNSLPSDRHDLIIQPCSRLEILTSTPTGQRSRAIGERLDGPRLLSTSLSDRDLLLSIGRALDVAVRPDVVLRRMEEQQKDKNRVRIAQTPDLDQKLVLSIGLKSLLESIPQAALTALTDGLGRDLEDREVARLALAIDGYAVLQRHAGSLERNGLEPPRMWAGTRGARDWVRRFGFPIEFAGLPGDRRETEIAVEGPPVLGELHDYQLAIAGRIRDLLRPDAEMRRGLVPLPTGAGKTRIAVQALVEHMSETAGDVRFIWVAETDELCEQAIQTWSQVWRARGAPGMPITLSRLWASNTPEERDGKQVVVASIAQLDVLHRRGEGAWQTAYGWLADSAMIVIDEAHRSIGTQYTAVLSKLGGVKRVADITTPLLGLTATPFRGWNERETELLAGRYHRNQLDSGIFPGDNVYGHLQEMGVLARVRQIALEGASIALTDGELEDARERNFVSSSLEKRLGRDEGRNNTIIESLLQLDQSSTVLLFASSVENARVLAAMLTFHGVEARAISGDTDPAARRLYVADFKERNIRVLTNYNVFTEGFDVPSIDAVYITRPTFSPNVYQQMIGRGLRGPLNGGKEEVLVVNVADNLTNFGEQFAFHHFAHLWNRSG